MIKIQRQEWLWATGWAAAILVITGLPYLYGAAISTPSNQFGGFIIGVEDGNSYLAKMQEGRYGSWLFYLAYTPEPHAGALFFSYYVLLGKLSTLLGLAPPIMLHLSRVVTIPFSLVSFYYFAAYFTGHVAVRRWAFVLFSTTAGLGWLWVILGLPTALGSMPVDLWVPDATFFLSALTFPHLPLAQGLLLWLIVASLEFLREGRWHWWAVAAGSNLMVSLIHPYTFPIIGTLLGLHCLWRFYQQKKWSWSAMGLLAAIAAPVIPYLLYVLFVFETNFAFRAWREQSLTFSPHPIHYFLGFGVTIPLAFVGLVWGHRLLAAPVSFLKVWMLVIPLLLYLPIALQRRFLDGYQAPLAVFGAAGLVWFMDRLRSRRQRVLGYTSILAPMVLTPIFLLTGGLLVVGQQQAPVFHPAAQQAAFGWLSTQARDQVVLAAYETGNLLPAYAPVRVFVGHGPETIRSEEKRQLVRQFFAGETSDEWRRSLLAEYNIRFLYYGPRERDLGDFKPAGVPYLRQVYESGEITLYVVME